MNAPAALRGRPAVADRWRFALLLAAPHRLAFAAGTLMLVVTSLWWAGVLLAPDTSGPGRLAPALAHGLLMTFGFLPMFFSGFLFTAGPKWLALRPVAARELLPHLLAQLSGWAVFLLALHGRDAAFGRSVGAIGLAAVALGWSGIARRFIVLVSASTVADRVHAKLAALGAACGAAALATAAVGLMAAHDELVRAATQIGLWGFVGLVYVSAAHRTIPALSAAAVAPLDARWPHWLLWSLVALCGFEAAAEAVALLTGPPPPVWQGMRAAIEFGAGGALLARVLRGMRLQRRAGRLAAMLHIGCGWLAAAVLMSGLAHAAAAAGSPVRFGAAPTHAYTMGFLGSTLLAMVTRVSSGLRGRALAADDLVWRLFWILQLAILARLAAAFLMPVSASWGMALVGAAATGWAGVVTVWGLRHLRWYGTPRPAERTGRGRTGA